MAEEMRGTELTLAEIENGAERRMVSLIEGESLALVERSSGPVTKVAYGTSYHGHKILFSAQACAKAFGVNEAHAAEALVRLYDNQHEAPLLSDVMDSFDRAGQSYRYMAWSGTGDVVFRSEMVA